MVISPEHRPHHHTANARARRTAQLRKGGARVRPPGPRRPGLTPNTCLDTSGIPPGINTLFPCE